MLKNVQKALEQAIPGTEATLTEKLRQSAIAHGWHPDVVAHMNVQHKDGAFHAVIAPEYSDRAFVHEFGDESSRPTAVLRKFGNDTNAIHQTYMDKVNEQYGRLR